MHAIIKDLPTHTHNDGDRRRRSPGVCTCFARRSCRGRVLDCRRCNCSLSGGTNLHQHSLRRPVTPSASGIPVGIGPHRGAAPLGRSQLTTDCEWSHLPAIQPLVHRLAGARDNMESYLFDLYLARRVQWPATTTGLFSRPPLSTTTCVYGCLGPRRSCGPTVARYVLP